mmetsp:Transcript_66967/g.217943  ORF Transcript_66967/g.217943 Transcript_66967/m.217943 type:complete len:231 (+) Transcript_66967:932-1624(+)
MEMSAAQALTADRLFRARPQARDLTSVCKARRSPIARRPAAPGATPTPSRPPAIVARPRCVLSASAYAAREATHVVVATSVAQESMDRSLFHAHPELRALLVAVRVKRFAIALAAVERAATRTSHQLRVRRPPRKAWSRRRRQQRQQRWRKRSRRRRRRKRPRARTSGGLTCRRTRCGSRRTSRTTTWAAWGPTRGTLSSSATRTSAGRARCPWTWRSYPTASTSPSSPG